MSKDSQQPDDVYEHEDEPKTNKRAAFSSWLKSRRGKISIIAASGLVLVGATAAAGLVGSNLIKHQDFGSQFGGGQPDGHHGPAGALGYGDGPGDHDGKFDGPKHDRDGDRDFEGGRPHHGPGEDHDGFTPPNTDLAPTDSSTPGTKS